MYNKKLMLKIKLYRLEVKTFKAINRKSPQLANLFRKNLKKNILKICNEVEGYI